ncbi:MAG: DMT family transporter [Lachnospiraceae bacterium]|nr:DMT family transporter [Lachnospiraceae bacterium]
MLYLVLAVVSSVLISVLMRVSEKSVKNPMLLFVANYFVCILISIAYMGQITVDLHAPKIGTALVLGICSGILYLLGFVLLQYNIRKNGVVLSSTFMRLGVLVPTAMAVLVFHEKPNVTQLLGFLVALAAILVMNLKMGESKELLEKTADVVEAPTEKKKVPGIVWLIILLLTGGFTDSLANVYDKAGNPDLKNQYLLFIFFVAFVCSVIGALLQVKKQKTNYMDFVWGFLIGIPNYYSARFLLLSLGKLPAILVYPAFNVATILVVTLVGVIGFKEKLEKNKVIALGMILLALVLLNI